MWCRLAAKHELVHQMRALVVPLLPPFDLAKAYPWGNGGGKIHAAPNGQVRQGRAVATRSSNTKCDACASGFSYDLKDHRRFDCPAGYWRPHYKEFGCCEETFDVFRCPAEKVNILGRDRAYADYKGISLSETYCC